jgi:hypothetical protein
LWNSQTIKAARMMMPKSTKSMGVPRADRAGGGLFRRFSDRLCVGLVAASKLRGRALAGFDVHQTIE